MLWKLNIMLSPWELETKVRKECFILSQLPNHSNEESDIFVHESSPATPTVKTPSLAFTTQSQPPPSLACHLSVTSALISSFGPVLSPLNPSLLNYLCKLKILLTFL